MLCIVVRTDRCQVESDLGLCKSVMSLHGLSVSSTFDGAIRPTFGSCTFVRIRKYCESPAFVRGLLTDFLLEAHQNPHLPYYLLLDETNLSNWSIILHL